MEATKELEEVTIDWGAFEHGHELDAVRKLYAAGSFNMIPSVIVNMTREKEEQIQKMIDSRGVNVLQSESAVAREFREEEARLGRFPISTPEEEAHWQAKFDAEKAERNKLVGDAPKAGTEGTESPRLSQPAPQTKPICATCGREFGNKGLLTMHMKAHDSIAKSQPAANV